MSSLEFIDLRDSRDASRPVVRMELDPDVSLGELVRVLSASGLTLSTLHGGRQLIHRAPKEAA